MLESGTEITTSRLGRMLARELVADAAPHPVDGLPVHAAVGAREVDVLEDAVLRLACGLERLTAAQSLRVETHQLAGRDVAQILGADQIERAGLARDHVAIAEPAQESGRNP